VALVLELSGGSAEKAAARVALPEPIPLEARSAVTAEVRGRLERPVAVAVGLEIGPDREYFESAPVPVDAAGSAREVTFPLDESTWKSARSEWQARNRVPGGLLHRVSFLLYGSGAAGEVVIDKLRLRKE
jgi:hypothetical protein